MKYKIILWDFDGTLADTAMDVWASLDYAAQQCGGELPDSFKSRSNLSLPMSELYSMVTPFPGDEKSKIFEKLVQVHYRTKNRFDQTVLYPGIKELLRSLQKNGVANYIVTMKPEQALKSILIDKGWHTYFEGSLSPDSYYESLQREMTKAEMIATVIVQTDFDKKDYVYIGDTWSDVEASRKNQIDCIGVTYGDGNEDMLRSKKPKYCARSVDEIACILNERE